MVSVCMAVYNGEKYIREQIDSILPQLGIDDEIIISDDESTDKTIDILRSYKDTRIKIFLHLGDKSGLNSSEIVGRNFENALRQAQGDYIFIADQDDLWMPNKVSILCKALETKYVAISNGKKFIEANPSNVCGMLYTDKLPIRNYYLRRGKYFGCALAFRREALNIIFPFPKRMPLYDHWIGLICELIGGAAYIPMPLILHRIHGTNTSENTSFPMWYKIYYRLRFLVQIYTRVFFCKIFINTQKI